MTGIETNVSAALGRDPSFGEKTTRIIVFLLLLTGSFGHFLLSVDVGFAQLYAFRMLMVGITVVMFVRGAFFRRKDSLSKGYYFICYIWIIWGLISLLAFTDTSSTGVNEVAGTIIGLLLGLIFLESNISTERGIGFLRSGWFLAFIATGVVAVWSFQTGENLESNWARVAKIHYILGITASTFDNPNNYAGFLALSLPFHFLSIQLSKTRFMKLLFIITSIITFVFILTTYSRLGLLAAISVTVIYAAILLFSRSPKAILAILTLAITSLAIIVLIATTFFDISLDAPGYNSSQDTSESVRLNLTLNGLWFMWNSAGLGIGPGNYERYISNGLGPYPTFDNYETVTDPHNFWIEVGSQYGLIVLLPLLIWLIWTYRIFISAYRIAELRPYAMLGIAGLPAYVIVGATSSSFIPGQINWMFFASYTSVAVFVYQELKAREGKEAAKVAARVLDVLPKYGQRTR